MLVVKKGGLMIAWPEAKASRVPEFLADALSVVDLIPPIVRSRYGAKA